MWRTIVDTKQGKVWANIPPTNEMMVVADADINPEDYFQLNKIIKEIRDEHDEQRLKIFEKLMEKNFEKTVDPDINLGHNINSDRGNPSDLWKNLRWAESLQ